MPTIKDQFQGVLYTKDGEDHINLSAFGETMLGRLSSPEWRRPFFIPHLGEFKSVRGFVQWLATGDDSKRFNEDRMRVGNMSSNDYHTLMIFAKYYQMNSFAGVIRGHSKELELPWVSYKVFTNGVRQYNPWTNYTILAKEMAQHILVNGVRETFPWATRYPAVMGIVNTHIASVMKIMGNPFIPFENMEEHAQAVNKARREAATASRDQRRTQSTVVRRSAPDPFDIDRSVPYSGLLEEPPEQEQPPNTPEYAGMAPLEDGSDEDVVPQHVSHQSVRLT
jgi:hypothetical protein